MSTRTDENKKTHSNILVKRTNRLNLLLRQLKRRTRQILHQLLWVLRLGNDSNPTLSRPAEENLCGSYTVLVKKKKFIVQRWQTITIDQLTFLDPLCDTPDYFVLEER